MSGDHATAIFNGPYNDYGPGRQGMKDYRGGSVVDVRPLISMLIPADEPKYVDVKPPASSLRFTGQRKHLDQLQECFASPRPAVGSEEAARRCALLQGIGGAGKTQLALKFAEESSKR